VLKLTTDKHEASRGLSATAELLVRFNREKKLTKAGHKLHKISRSDQSGGRRFHHRLGMGIYLFSLHPLNAIGCPFSSPVVRECCKGDDESQWRNLKFDPHHAQTP